MLRLTPRLAAITALALAAACSGGTHQPTNPLPVAMTMPGAATHAVARSDRFEGVTGPDLAAWAQSHVQAEARRAASPAAHAFTAERILPVQRRDITGYGKSKLLVLYDASGTWAYLGELYAMAVANLGTRFGSVSLESIAAYQSGQLAAYDASIYVGSTYYDPNADPVPHAFYTDAFASTKPLVWLNDNIWNYANAVGPVAFERKYGWDPTTSYFAPSGSVGNVSTVIYKGQTLLRSFPVGTDGGVLHPHLLGAGYPPVQTLAQAVDASTPGVTFPWAIRSSNLTYVGEIPFQYVTESDRVIAFEDMLFDAAAPQTLPAHRALIRLEDLSASDDPQQLQQVATWLAANHIPYSFNVIPLYTDPLGHYTNGVPETIALKNAPHFVNVLKYMIAHGGTMVDEGYTHQYGTANNPYDATSGDDAEFFLAHIDPSTDRVLWDGPVPGDSAAYALNRVKLAKQQFSDAKLPQPLLWVTPHYYASAADYSVFATQYVARYDRGLYFSGMLAGTPSAAHYIGQFFPYPVRDMYGGIVLPENLGDYEPVPLNGNPVRQPQDIINEAGLNLAVRDGYASFFYDPSWGTAPLSAMITGIRLKGYTFVAPADLIRGY